MINRASGAKNILNNILPNTHSTEFQLTKRKVAVRVGYVGTGFHGSQKLKDYDTIEPVIEKALYDSKLISELNFGELSKIGWSRSSRTDKGVHSVCSVFGMKLFYNWKKVVTDDLSVYDIDDQCKELPAIINNHLPDNVKVFSMHSVSKGWDARNFCSAREYEYIIPFKFLEGTLFETNPQAMVDALNLFKGNHCWHNFTPIPSTSYSSDSMYLYKKGECASLHRNIEEFSFEIKDINGIKSVVFTISGQSFLMHQIRKTIASVFLYSKGLISKDFIHASIDGPWRVPLPKAPSEGLLLNSARFSKLDLENKINESSVNDFKTKILIPHIQSLWDEDLQGVLNSITDYFSEFNFETIVSKSELENWKEQHIQRVERKKERKILMEQLKLQNADDN